jgi:PLP dependent protein
MGVNKDAYQKIKQECENANAILVAVSKTKPASDILELYDLGQRDFGENYVQELTEKAASLPKDIRWHFIGHLQSNKVKTIASFVHLIHGVDSFKLLEEINKHGKKNNRIISILLQMHIAREETKFGLDEQELKQIMDSISQNPKENVSISGLMGMASFTEDTAVIQSEFSYLENIFLSYSGKTAPGLNFNTLSMGMSSDYKIALRSGSNMVRIGSLLFGERK